MLTPTLPSSTVPVDSVNIQFTFEKMEPGTSPKKTYYYHLSIQNNSNEAVYVIIPRWFETLPLKGGVMESCDNDSHDGIVEYSFYTNPSFEIYAIKPHAKIEDKE